MRPEDLWGTWKLEKFEQLGPDGLPIVSHPNSRGILIYTSEGSMSVSMSREIQSSDPDIQRNFVRDLYYAGRFEVQGELILHHVEIAVQEAHRNQSLIRRARLEDSGQKLVLEALSPEKRVLGSIYWLKQGTG